MSELNVTEVRDMAYDLYKGRTANFDAESANEAIKNIILETAGCRDQWDMYKFMENKYKVFSIMREILTPVVAENVLARFESWVDIQDIALGDTKEFEIMNQELFEIGLVADGTSELRRQNLVHGKIQMTSFQLGAKLYTEFDDFRRGRVDFAEWIARLGKSFEVKIGEFIVRAIESSYSVLGAKFAKTGAFDDAEMLKIVERVEAKTGMKAVIYGTKSALAKLRTTANGFQAVLADRDKDAISAMGHIGTYFGTDVVEIPQSVNRKDDFMIDNNMLYVIPNGTKIVKLLFEGDVDVVEVTDPAVRKDMQFEYMFMRRIQIGVCKASVYGIYKVTA